MKDDFDCEATYIPLTSSIGCENSAMHRIYYVNGKFALYNLLCALISKNEKTVNTRFLYELFMVNKDEYFVSLMEGTSNMSLHINKLGI
jgi:restriction endonuclease S subunit